MKYKKKQDRSAFFLGPLGRFFDPTVHPAARAREKFVRGNCYRLVSSSGKGLGATVSAIISPIRPLSSGLASPTKSKAHVPAGSR
jgi:hypothetical protein